MSLTLEVLSACMPRLKPLMGAYYLPALNAAMDEAKIDTPIRQAAFLAQLAHESGQLRYWAELWGPSEAQKRYEGRADLGNVQTGDGFRFRGRGPIQLTGRRNYRVAGVALGLDLESEPERVSEPETGFRVAGWFWKRNGLNVLADQCGDDPSAFDRVTRRINGGLNGKADRDALFARARGALGC